MDTIELKIARLLVESADLALERAPQCATTICESPIERLLMLAFWSRGMWTGRCDLIVRSTPAGLVEASQKSGWPAFTMQAWHGPYRLDFLFALRRPLLGDVMIAVECDGHDFHERTKEQASRDKSRDRELVASGVQVLRFTGSEIWKDAGGCADEVLRILDAAMVEELWARNQREEESAKPGDSVQ